MPDALPRPHDPRSATDASLARAHGWHADTRPGYHHPETEAEKRARYPNDLTRAGFHTRSAIVTYCQHIGGLIGEYDAHRHGETAYDIVRDLVKFATWPCFEGGLTPVSPSKDWFVPADSVQFAWVSAHGGATKRIVNRKSYDLFSSFGGQHVPVFSSDRAPMAPNRDAYAVFTVLGLFAAETARADPARVGAEETVWRYRMLALLLSNLLGIEDAPHPVTVLMPSRRPGSPSVAITVDTN